MLAVLRKTFLIGKYSNFNFQNRGYFVKKMFRKFVETSVIISLNRDNWLYLTQKFQKKLSGKKSSFNFQNRGFFGGKKSKSHQVAGTFFKIIKISPGSRHFFEKEKNPWGSWRKDPGVGFFFQFSAKASKNRNPTPCLEVYY